MVVAAPRTEFLLCIRSNNPTFQSFQSPEKKSARVILSGSKELLTLGVAKRKVSSETKTSQNQRHQTALRLPPSLPTNRSNLQRGTESPHTGFSECVKEIFINAKSSSEHALNANP